MSVFMVSCQFSELLQTAAAETKTDMNRIGTFEKLTVSIDFQMQGNFCLVF